jgi:hypothetical protein
MKIRFTPVKTMKTETEKTPVKPPRCDVAVLCVTPRSHYKKIAGCDCYDAKRDAWTFPGGLPVVAHPPCRSWGRLAHFVKEDVTIERGLAERCVDMVLCNNGVLEHPAHSRLWEARGLPLPGEHADEWGGWTLGLFQCWFGHRWMKDTWLYILGCDPLDVPTLPFALKGNYVRTDNNISANQRKATPPAFAEWLVALARLCGKRKGAAA